MRDKIHSACIITHEDISAFVVAVLQGLVGLPVCRVTAMYLASNALFNGILLSE